MKSKDLNEDDLDDDLKDADAEDAKQLPAEVWWNSVKPRVNSFTNRLFLHSIEDVSVLTW